MNAYRLPADLASWHGTAGIAGPIYGRTIRQFPLHAEESAWCNRMAGGSKGRLGYSPVEPPRRCRLTAIALRRHREFPGLVVPHGRVDLVVRVHDERPYCAIGSASGLPAISNARVGAFASSTTPSRSAPLASIAIRCTGTSASADGQAAAIHVDECVVRRRQRLLEARSRRKLEVEVEGLGDFALHRAFDASGCGRRLRAPSRQLAVVNSGMSAL